MRVKVRHRIDNLGDRLESTITRLHVAAPRVVKDNADYGRDLAKALARAKAGPHGSAYYKRINSESTNEAGADWSAEFGPDGSPKTEFVGVGFRSGTNTDLERAAAAAGPSMARDVGKMIRGMFA